MTERALPGKATNPFYVFLLIVSTLFVLTALGYLMGPFVQQQAVARPSGGPSPGSRAMADWLDRRGPTALAVEFVLMFGSGFLAMLTEHWRGPKRGRGGEAPASQSGEGTG